MQGSGVLGLKAQRGQWLASGCTARPRPPVSPSSMFPHTLLLTFLQSPQQPPPKTSEPIKGAGKIMNKPGKHEINIRRKK